MERRHYKEATNWKSMVAIKKLLKKTVNIEFNLDIFLIVDVTLRVHL
jgi:hypothetical protein